MNAPGFTSEEQRAEAQKLRDRLIVLPEARPPRRRRVIAAIVIGLVLALVAGSAIGYAYQRKQVRISRADTAAAQRDLDTARAGASQAAAGANTKITDLQSQVGDLQDQLTLATNAKDLATLGQTSAQQRSTQLAAKLAATQAALASLTGSRLHHGWHIGYVRLVGASATPDVVVIDIGRWFTGADARAAAIADGVITAGEHLPNPRYLRNLTFDLRTVSVTSTVAVTVRHRGANHPTTVTLADLEKIFDSGGSANDRVRLDPFWVHVTDGQIDRIREQQYP